VFAGAVCAAALSFVLLVLGFGLGMSASSPWSDAGVSASTLGISSILWLTFTQIAASGLGGYIAGRLRVRWVGLHTTETYFRDTAHGLISWSVATLVAVFLVGSSVTSVISGGAKAGAAVVSGGASAVSSVNTDKLSDNVSNYLTDTLLRKDPSATNTEQASAEIKQELSTLIVHDLSDGDISDSDKRYAAQIIAKHTGITVQDASARIDSTIAKAKKNIEIAKTKAKEAVDATRKAAAYSALWMFVALMCGAFFASLMATFGGRQRDLHV
jgi:hypothetical protein